MAACLNRLSSPAAFLDCKPLKPRRTTSSSTMTAKATRSLGKIHAPPLGFGCMSLTPGMYGEDVDMVESEACLRKALDSGPSLLNTADFYTSMTSGETSQNLKLIGKVLKDYPREKVIVAMKWGAWVEGGWTVFDNSPEGCRKRVEDALKLLGTDYIDLLILRKAPRPDKHNTPLEDTAKGMKAMVDAGKVKAIGLSEFSADDLKKVHAIVPVSAVELEWSLFARHEEKELIPAARSIGAGIIAYAPMGRGMLTGKYDPTKISATDFRNTSGTHQGEALDKNIQLVKRISELAEKKGCTTGQLAIAWVLAQGDDVVPIPGTKRTKYLVENMKALDVKLSKEEEKELRDVIQESDVSGERQQF